MRLSFAITWLVVSAAPLAAGAAAPVRDQVLRPGDRINTRGERQTNMEAVEAAHDRGDGRLTPDAQWELDRIDAYQDRRYVPGRDFQLFDQARDRQLRVDSRAARTEARPSARPTGDAGAVDLGIVPDDLVPRGEGGISPLAAQLYEDERTLAAADAGAARLLKQLDEAEARELNFLRARLDREGRGGEFDASAAKVRADYAKWRDQARAEERQTRSRLNGAPATRPAGGGKVSP